MAASGALAPRSAEYTRVQTPRPDEEAAKSASAAQQQPEKKSALADFLLHDMATTLSETELSFGREGPSATERSTRLWLGVWCVCCMGFGVWWAWNLVVGWGGVLFLAYAVACLCFSSLHVRLESPFLQLVVVLLVLLDVLAVFGEILLVVVCHEDGPTGEGGEEGGHRLLESGGDEEGHSLSEQVEEGLHVTSLAILAIFLLQQVLLIGVFQLKFFRKPMYVLDLVIVAVAMGLEVQENPGGGLLAVILLWRVVRVVHGFAVTIETEHHATEEAEKQAKLLHERARRLAWRLRNARAYPATFLRLTNFSSNARVIWTWWSAVKREKGGGMGAGAVEIGGVEGDGRRAGKSGVGAEKSGVGAEKRETGVGGAEESGEGAEERVRGGGRRGSVLGKVQSGKSGILKLPFQHEDVPESFKGSGEEDNEHSDGLGADHDSATDALPIPAKKLA